MLHRTLPIAAQLWHDWDIFDKVAWHHSPGFMLPSDALETIKFTVFVREPLPYFIIDQNSPLKA